MGTVCVCVCVCVCVSVCVCVCVCVCNAFPGKKSVVKIRLSNFVDKDAKNARILSGGRRACHAAGWLIVLCTPLLRRYVTLGDVAADIVLVFKNAMTYVAVCVWLT
jgi:hypothetical protein